MPWQERLTVQDQRHEFCVLADSGQVPLAELCRRYRISRKTGYKWLARFAQDGAGGLLDRSRRPRHSPGKITPAMEQQIIALRQQQTTWAGRKLRRRLQDLGQTQVPAASTIQRVIARNGLQNPDAPSSKPYVRFEHPHPNDLWQMDFKGHFATGAGRCHPLTVLDDHSRFCLGLRGCDDERACTVKAELERIFHRYGLPSRILCDHGSPWGDDIASPHTQLTIWLLRLGVAVSHGRPYHPQTQGKEERFHRTIQAELLGTRCFADGAEFQVRADRWREDYNLIRPHEALGLATPASRYRPSSRVMPAVLPAIEYNCCDAVRKVDDNGWISYQGQYHKIGRAFAGQPIALRPEDAQGTLGVYFSHHKIKTLALRASGH